MHWKKQWLMESLSDARAGRRKLLTELCETESTRFVIGWYMSQLVELELEIEFLERVLELEGNGNIDDAIERAANEFIQQLAAPPKSDITSACVEIFRRDSLLRIIRKYYREALYNVRIAPNDDEV